MGSRDYQVPESFVIAMGKTIKGLSKLSNKQRVRLSYFIWTAGLNRRRHKKDDSFMSIGYVELNAAFGRDGFNQINSALKIFEVTKQWWHSRGLTKGYKLTEPVEQAKDKYLKSKRPKITRMMAFDGQAVRTLPEAIAAKDLDDVTATAWKEAKPFNNIPVDLEAMRHMYEHLSQMVGKKTGDLFHDDAEVDYILYRVEILGQLIRLANTDVAGIGHISHRYAQGRTGRLYARGISLQTAPKTIRHAALHGLYDYDIENCHYAIITQLASRYGLTCKFINDYIARKDEVRKQLSNELGISISQVKMCLLAIMYGARMVVRKGNAITDEIGEQKAKLLFKHELFIDIYADTLNGRKLILDKWKKSRKTLTNDMGKRIRLNEPAEKRLAHLIQGIEAKALMSAIKLYPDDIVLLMHDGFVSKRSLDVTLMKRHMYEDTGYRLELSTKVIVVPDDLDINR
jgi:hypothetical protein